VLCFLVAAFVDVFYFLLLSFFVIPFCAVDAHFFTFLCYPLLCGRLDIYICSGTRPPSHIFTSILPTHATKKSRFFPRPATPFDFYPPPEILFYSDSLGSPIHRVFEWLYFLLGMDNKIVHFSQRKFAPSDFWVGRVLVCGTLFFFSLPQARFSVPKTLIYPRGFSFPQRAVFFPGNFGTSAHSP